jgi:hypothetical protein
MTADEWQKQFEELWKQVFDPNVPNVRLHFTNFGRRQILVNHTGPVELKPEIKDENGHTIYETEYLKDNEWGFKDFVPYRTESHRVWRKTEKGWDLYTPMYKIDRDNGEQYTVYQEATKEFLTGATNE